MPTTAGPEPADPSRVLQRTYVCERLVFATRTNDPALAGTLAQLLADFTGSSAAPTIVFEMQRPADDDLDHRWELTKWGDPSTPEPIVIHAPTSHGMVDALIDHLDRDVLAATPDRLHVHAGLGDRDGRAVITIGPSHAGKSTLGAALARHGCTYRTDEMVSIGEGGDDRGDDERPPELSWVPKPLGLRADAARRLDLGPVDGAADGVVHGVAVTHVAPSALSRSDAEPTAGPVRPGLLLALERDDRAVDPHIEPCHPADLAVAVLEQSFDTARLGPPALHLAARLAAASRCGRLVYGEADDAAPLVVAALDDIESVPPGGVTVRDAPGADGTAGPRRSPDASSVHVGDRVVVLHLPSRRIVALDATLSSLWDLFDGRSTTASLADELADTADGDAAVIRERLGAAIAHLVQHDLVEPAPDHDPR